VRSPWNVGIALAGLLALALIGIGATYLSVEAGSLPSALGKVAGSTSRDSTRGFFVVMVGCFMLLITIVLTQLRPGGGLTVTIEGDRSADDGGVAPEPQRPAAVDEPATQRPAVVEEPQRPAAVDERGTEYIGEVDDEPETDPILSREARRREERRAVEEAGGGESEGFELAEEALIEHASHGDEHTPSRIMQDAVGPDEEPVDSENGEADAEHLPD
jgi:hypothetical protein